MRRSRDGEVQEQLKSDGFCMTFLSFPEEDWLTLATFNDTWKFYYKKCFTNFFQRLLKFIVFGSPFLKLDSQLPKEFVLLASIKAF